MVDWKKNIVSSLAFLAVNVVLFINGTKTLKETAFLYPRAIILLCSACCVILLIQGIVGMVRAKKKAGQPVESCCAEAAQKEEAAVVETADETAAKTAPEAAPDADAEKKQKMIKRTTAVTIAVCCAALLAYIIAIEYIGYILSTLLFIGGVLYYLKIRKFWVIALTSVGVTAFLYVMFNYVLMVMLPIGSLFYNLLY